MLGSGELVRRYSLCTDEGPLGSLAAELAADLLGVKAASHLFGDLPEPIVSCLGTFLHELF
jgi:hypothetical protein